MCVRFFFLYFLISTISAPSSAQSSYNKNDKTIIYSALSDEDTAMIEQALNIVSEFNTNDAKAYKGALLMKKASFLNTVKSKLSTFKSGHDLLEEAIKHQPDFVEYRFLRLMIQEHAPKFLTYHDEIKTDATYIINNFDQLSPEIRQEVEEYSKSSKALNKEDFN